MLNAPWTCVKAGSSTLKVCQSTHSASRSTSMNSRGEIAIKIECTFDHRKFSEPVNLLQHGVVCNLVTVIDRSELRKGNVGKIGVVDEDQTAHCGKIWGCKRLHGVTIKSQILGDIGQRRKRNRAAVPECHILSGFEHGESRLKTSHESIICLNVQGVLDAGHL